MASVRGRGREREIRPVSRGVTAGWSFLQDPEFDSCRLGNPTVLSLPPPAARHRFLPWKWAPVLDDSGSGEIPHLGKPPTRGLICGGAIRGRSGRGALGDASGNLGFFLLGLPEGVVVVARVFWGRFRSGRCGGAAQFLILLVGLLSVRVCC